MLVELDFQEFRAVIDPESNFWAIYDDEIPDEIREFYVNNREKLKAKMEEYRFTTDIKTLYLYPTERCNARCPYCYIPNSVKDKGRDMSYNLIEEILTKAYDLGVKWVIFHGSEPMLVKDKIFKAIEDFDFNFGIQTNGTLIDEDDAQFLMDMEVSVGISFDCCIEEVNDMVRGKGHFRSVMNALELFNGYNRLNVITTITKYNYKYLPDMIDFLAGKVKTVLMNPVRGTNAQARSMRPPSSFTEYYIEAIERSIEHTKNGQRIVIGDFANILLGLVAPTSRVLQCDISPCGGGRRFIAVTVDGVYPCGEFIGLKEFRVDLKELDNIPNHFKDVKSRVVEKIQDCSTCPYRNLCGAPCPAEVFSEYGTMLEKSPYCEFYKSLSEYAFRVIARGDDRYVLKLEKLKPEYSIVQ